MLVITPLDPFYMPSVQDTLTLVLTRHWYDETDLLLKRVEYREMSPHWKRLIWDRRHDLKYVRFFRAMTKTNRRFAIDAIDIGPCPIDGWSGEYYRIAFSPEPDPDCPHLCPDCGNRLYDIGGIWGCLCLWGGKWPTAGQLEEFVL